MTMGNNRSASLTGYIERIERKREEISLLKQDEKDLFTELTSAGFNGKVVRQMLRERQMTAAEREEYQADLQIYRAALGMLDGTPLGDAARKRFTRQPKPSDTVIEDERQAEMPGVPEPVKPPTAEQLAAARDEGAEAARAGKKVTDNPYAADDRRRSEWDTGWCQESGSDGMDIPEAWRRQSKKKGANDDGHQGADKDAA
jgi:uncharacterized protein (UPF0335 family)